MKIRLLNAFVFVFFVVSVSLAETNSVVLNLNNPELSRFKKLQKNAFSYAYYLRSSYLRNCVNASLKSGKPDEISKKLIVNSLVFLEKTLKYASDVPFLWKEYAVYNGGIGRVNGVVYAYKKLAELEPSAEIHYKLGQLYNSKSDFDNAVEQFELYLNFHPNDSKVKEYLVQLLINAGLKSEKFNNHVKAKSYYKQAINTLDDLLNYSENATFYFKKGSVQELLNNSDDALESYSKAIFIEPDNPESYLRASNIYYAKGENAAYSGNPEKANEYYSEAANTILLIVPEIKDNPEILNYAAYLLALLGERLDLAEKLVMRAIEKDKENGAFIDTLGWINFKKGNVQNALENTLKARKNAGNDPVISDHLGDIYLKLGFPNKAKEMWLKSLDFDDNNTNVKIKINALEKINP